MMKQIYLYKQKKQPDKLPSCFYLIKFLLSVFRSNFGGLDFPVHFVTFMSHSFNISLLISLFCCLMTDRTSSISCAKCVSIVIYFLCDSCDSFDFDDLQHISCIFSRCKRSVRSPYGTLCNLRTECPVVLIALTWRCGYAALESSLNLFKK